MLRLPITTKTGCSYNSSSHSPVLFDVGSSGNVNVSDVGYVDNVGSLCRWAAGGGAGSVFGVPLLFLGSGLTVFFTSTFAEDECS